MVKFQVPQHTKGFNTEMDAFRLSTKQKANVNVLLVVGRKFNVLLQGLCLLFDVALPHGRSFQNMHTFLCRFFRKDGFPLKGNRVQFRAYVLDPRGNSFVHESRPFCSISWQCQQEKHDATRCRGWREDEWEASFLNLSGIPFLNLFHRGEKKQ